MYHLHARRALNYAFTCSLAWCTGVALLFYQLPEFIRTVLETSPHTLSAYINRSSKFQRIASGGKLNIARVHDRSLFPC